ncbi:MAG: hypothetical protein A2504_15790 [Bdellovibrionales bacterium RIFOXYD12_FULL_39_22]|nr:MAG: hypothetical protein A2385_07700 [Bdellovibrionales bacterium RIFOXYB1_FULL_39_21]OFZ43057.1 MAG: hypothetical protein A2485_11525 [Bdellovibrionales bacterium RIFOXYC12_FULL_39_17]OFZ50857.1 MAG: hypothetical protein A2404_06615 [Bdellovibrionales bacterium RIFOXYC1_FULL_39_130]OFZ71715.1 MAG: hypothetical protein A2451_14380 [Bdellovibrionales bacterium RIFOXYC2_FULL_39_8]OFZ78080.1 MAG: hypothetical protein A2560_01785 [Bdellovibrionales bacterium RIFOXYD1_FULL_39_84]OFZ93948.1 MAG:
MKVRSEQLPQSLFFTILLLLALEIVASTFFPIIGLVRFRPAFNILIVLYVGFKLETPFVALVIFAIQYFHSFFSVEGWAAGTFAGIIICMIISYLREMIHFSTALVTIVVVEIFQIIWFIIASLLLYLKTDNITYVYEKFFRFIPESIIIALVAPYCFTILDRIWHSRNERKLLGDVS